MSAPAMAQGRPARHSATMAASKWDKAIGRRLCRLREARSWTMNELASRCPGGLATASQINKLEKGQQQFSAQWIYRLAQALGCPVAELMEDWATGSAGNAQALAGRIYGLAEPDREAIERIVDTISHGVPSAESEQ